MNTPWDRSYWVVPRLFLAGCYPGDPNPDAAASKMRALKAAGIRHIVNLMEEDEANYGFITMIASNSNAWMCATSGNADPTRVRPSKTDAGTATGRRNAEPALSPLHQECADTAGLNQGSSTTARLGQYPW